MLKKIRRILRLLFIGSLWSGMYFAIVYYLFRWLWKFDILNKEYWKVIAKFWDNGGAIDSFSEFSFVIALLAVIPLWIWGWRKAMNISLVKVIFFPIFWYHDRMERKYAQMPKAIKLKNMGGKTGKQNPKQALEEMIASRMPKEKEKKDLNSSKIRSSFEEKNRSFHEKSGGQ